MIIRIVKILVVCLCLGWAAQMALFCEEAQLPVPEQVDQERYTMEEFMLLTDEAKIDIYYNWPKRLPENFTPDLFMKLFHPELVEFYKDAEIIPESSSAIPEL